jgi:hypothetical protein
MVFEFRRQGYKKTNKEKNNSNIPNEYAKIENSVKGEQKPQVDTDHTYGFIDEFIEEAINASKIHEYTQETDYIGFQYILRMPISVFLPEIYHNSIMDGGYIYVR